MIGGSIASLGKTYAIALQATNCQTGEALARAAALTGDTARARKAYQDFLALWKDADTDIPLLNEAKQEYAKLR